jgi:hypothetical protein
MKPMTCAFVMMSILALAGCAHSGSGGKPGTEDYTHHEVFIAGAGDRISPKFKRECLEKKGLDIDRIDRRKNDIFFDHGAKADGTRELVDCTLVRPGMGRAMTDYFKNGGKL